MWYVCAQLINPKRFLIILYAFGSDFYHSLCSCSVLTSFFIFLKCSVLQNRCLSFRDSRKFLRLASHAAQVTSSSRSFCDSSCDSPMTRENFHDSPSHETPRNSFLKGFSWETCFKPLLSSLKLLFHYFYIKTQSIWIVFHSINISKVIINFFHWF